MSDIVYVVYYEGVHSDNYLTITTDEDKAIEVAKSEPGVNLLTILHLIYTNICSYFIRYEGIYANKKALTWRATIVSVAS